MLFNSLGFLLFFPIVTLLYWILPTKLRNPFLLVASYYFYMSWEPVYALLILFSSVTTWSAAIMMSRHQTHKRAITWTAICINLAILFIYKYAGFVNDSVTDLLKILGIYIEIPRFTLLLPVGISFYTFQAVGYMIDVYRKTLKPERNLLTYMLFVAFFPQLVAGPIERAKNLLPQFYEKHRFNADAFIHGLYLMLWGYFMKLCIADNVSTYVDAVYNNLEHHNGTSILLATFFFTFQIFCDFGGYSLIAIGVARCVGFRLMTNFNHPYLALSVKDFWRRWHISLTSWFTDYVYIPLGGNRCSTLRHHTNLVATFLVSGLWHGANWTFVLWGGYHGLLIAGHSLKNKYLKKYSIANTWLWKYAGMILTFILMMIGWVFFRANNVGDAFTAFHKMVSERGTLFIGEGKPTIVLPILLIAVLMIKEYRDERKAINVATHEHTSLSSVIVKSIFLIAAILLCASFYGGQFIYFQF